jgi:hypothetical protein
MRYVYYGTLYIRVVLFTQILFMELICVCCQSCRDNVR